MKDEYGRKLQCPKCESKKISIVKDSEGNPSYLLFCEKCGMIGDITMFRAIPSSENPSRRDSDLEEDKYLPEGTVQKYTIEELLKVLDTFKGLEIDESK